MGQLEICIHMFQSQCEPVNAIPCIIKLEGKDGTPNNKREKMWKEIHEDWHFLDVCVLY